ncbi:putative oxidoreductase CzcO [Actinomadura sp. NBRC 104425]|uniref:flavin-containing monooxygenase n=1 Tax=Actinomadura sp. NBRC 104425 TaxID=3032204 RepID=UPI0024A2EE5E|nr:NAD(P)/FAD-dependent oxidoreductase [Actinomadura sp. NBRC 104425]GLZ14888.1 putative oxidoreductase CzcO [Actinomadura sp. NBRC 104425]
MNAPLDTLIIGGGQAGLALGHYLRRAGLDFAIVDAHPRVGESWRRRWDSLTLFTPRRYDALPGLPFPGDPDGHPGKDEVADYLERYAAHFDLPMHLNSRVEAVHPGPDGGFEVQTSAASYTAARVVIASGAFHTPRVPGFAADLAEDVVQLHSTGYRNPAQLPDGNVAVVGGGNTGVQIAGELADHGRRVALSAAALGSALPQRLLGRDVFWWFSRLGTMRLSGDSLLGRRLKAQNTIIGTDLKHLLGRVTRLDRAVGADNRELVLADGARHRVDAVVWATGFRPHYPWLHVPVLDESGAPVHEGGVTAWPGLYFLGLPWQRTRGSAVLGWVARDAKTIADLLLSTPAARSARPAPA